MSKFNHKEAAEELQHYRLTNERNSEKVCHLGARLIKDNYTAKLGDASKRTTIVSWRSQFNICMQ